MLHQDRDKRDETAGAQIDAYQQAHAYKEEILAQPEPSRLEHPDFRVLKSAELFMLCTRDGDVPWTLPHAYGVFLADCRFLDGWTLRINEIAPIALAGDDSKGYEARFFLTNPEMSTPNGELKKNTLGIRRERALRGLVLHEQLHIENHGMRPAHLSLALAFRCNFEDIFSVRGFVSQRRGRVTLSVEQDGTELLWQCEGLDGCCRTLTIAFERQPDAFVHERALYDLELAPQARASLALTITPGLGASAGKSSKTASQRAGQEADEKQEKAERVWLASNTRIESSSDLFDRVVRRALLDLRLLRSRIRECHYFAAGVPWFATLFGRDALLAAIQTLPFGPVLARQTLALVAQYQAQAHDAYRDAQPGKMLHELRRGELARLGKIPQSPVYYGTVDATMLFLILLAEYVAWSGDIEHAMRLRPNIDAALEWMERWGDSDGDGYFDYSGGGENGLVNQGWKDSGDAIVNTDGTLAKPPVALCEVQGYAFRAWRSTAWLLRRLGDAEQAKELEGRAERLRERFERDFWSERAGCYALARQRGGELAEVVSSNAGQMLWGGIASPERAARVAARMLKEDMYSGWGVRTLSALERRYNPMGYHLGSVWPHDNSLLIAGFRRYRHDQQALLLFDALFDAAAGSTNHRLPELFCGYPRGDSEAPVPYPVACSPQAWAAGALPYGLWSLLGLRADACAQELSIAHPLLPSSLDWLELSALRVGDAVVDLRFKRTGAGSSVVSVATDVVKGKARIRTEQ